MKLDRNLNCQAAGKYALLHLRRARAAMTPELFDAITVLDKAGLIEWGRIGEQDEFFAIKLKDENADVALYSYAAKAALKDKEYAAEVTALADRSGQNSPFCKAPD